MLQIQVIDDFAPDRWQRARLAHAGFGAWPGPIRRRATGRAASKVAAIPRRTIREQA
jgi:hypothetical protein